MPNVFSERPPAQKRIITVSLTREQDEEFERTKTRTDTKTDGALIKKALAHYIDWLDERETTPFQLPDQAGPLLLPRPVAPSTGGERVGRTS